MEKQFLTEKNIESLLAHYENHLAQGLEQQAYITQAAIAALCRKLPESQRHLPLKKLALYNLQQQKNLLTNKLLKTPQDYAGIVQLSEQISELYLEISMDYKRLRNKRKTKEIELQRAI